MIRRHVRFTSVPSRNNTKLWKDKLVNVPVFILGNGPSLEEEKVSLLTPYFTIGINRAFLKIDPTILFWQDVELWFTERKRILETSALKVCKNVSDPQNNFYHFRLENGTFRLPDDPFVLYGQGATGPLAVQFAYSLGCNPIILLGCDCKYIGKKTNFYGRNRHHSERTLMMCRKGLSWMKTITDRELISCSDNDIFERKSLVSVIESLDPQHRQSRSYWSQLLVN